jgi:hypothetical protein
VRRAALAAVVLAAAAPVAAGCGGDDEGGATTATVTAPVATATAPPTATGEQAPGGAGDEEAVRTPAAFTASGATLIPARITVPAFLAIDLTVTARGTAQTVTVVGAAPLDVAAGATAHRLLPGRKPGDYAVTTAAGAHAVLHVVNGGDPGP